MWTINIKSVIRVDDRVKVIVEFKFPNGVDSFDKEFSISNERDLRGMILGEVDRVKRLYEFADNLSLGPVDLTPDAPPSQEEQEFTTFLANYNKWQKVKKLIDLGILTGSEPQATNLKSLVQSQFKPEYINLL